MVSVSYPELYTKDLYALLQVHPKAHKDVITAAYKTLLKKCAPRAIGDDETQAKMLGEAHNVLKSAKERRIYDMYRKKKTTTSLGLYRIIEEIAEGGFGTTYKAEHVLLGEYSCIKHCSEVSTLAEKILKEETRAIWNLRHYGLPIMRDFLQLDDGSYALVMSWVPGLTIEQLVEKYGRLDPEQVAWMAERIINTFVYLHHSGVIHGDIKPLNIIVQEDTHIVTLVDFGLAAVKPSDSSSNKGYTELFSPPEQMNGGVILPGSDFYALGMTMIYALGGKYATVKSKEVPKGTPDAMCRFIKRLIVRNILERPRFAQDLFKDCEKMRQESFGRKSSNLKQFAL